MTLIDSGDRDQLDRRLFDRICANEASALGELLVDQCGPTLRYLAKRFHYDYGELISDLAIHVMEDNFRRLRTWEGRGSLAALVNMMAYRLCLSRAKKVGKGLVTLVSPERWERALQSAIAPPASEPRWTTSDLLRALETLSDRERLLINLHFFQELSIDATAKELSVTPENASVIKHRALKKLPAALRGRNDDV